MARLIDADAYAAEMRKRQENCRAWKDSLNEGTELYARAEQSFITFIEAALTLKNQPTIAAIPVEWLQESRRNSMDAQWHYAVAIVIRKWLEEQEVGV